MNQQEFSRNLLMKMAGDGKDRYRVEYNDILTDNAASSNNLTQEKYITIRWSERTSRRPVPSSIV